MLDYDIIVLLCTKSWITWNDIMSAVQWNRWWKELYSEIIQTLIWL